MGKHDDGLDVPDAFKKPPDSWSAVFGGDPDTCGKVLLDEDASSTIALAAMYLGFDNPFQLDDAQYAQVKEALKTANDCAKAYYSGFGDAANYFASGDATVGISLGSLIPKLTKKKGGDLVETLPKEGALVWTDCWMMTRPGRQTLTSPTSG